MEDTNWKGGTKADLQELHRLLTEAFLEVMRSGVPQKASFYAVLNKFLIDNGCRKDVTGSKQAALVEETADILQYPFMPLEDRDG